MFCDPTWMINLLRLFLLTNFITKAKDKPEQIHLSLGIDSSSEMVITWVTFQQQKILPSINYGESNVSLDLNQLGQSDLFIDGGLRKTRRWINRVRLTKLKSDTRYYYQISGDDVFYSFRTLKDGNNWSANVLIFGDLGYENSQTLPALIREVKTDAYDVIIHAGDIGYDLFEEEGHLADKFLNLIQPIASSIPYQVTMGNHEEKYNFSHYQSLFTMFDQTLKQQENSFYSFNLGLLHVVVFSSEFYEFTKYGMEQIDNQFKWLKADLQDANKQHNRLIRPWIITICHKPLYCDEARCFKDGRTLRNSLEELLFENKVDIFFVGHEHKYQRSWPVYEGYVYNGSYNEPYIDPIAPVQIVTGAAGNREKLDGHKELKGDLPWRAKTIYEYSYTKLLVVNESHLLIQQMSSSQVLLDQFHLIKRRRGDLYQIDNVDGKIKNIEIKNIDYGQTNNVEINYD